MIFRARSKAELILFSFRLSRGTGEVHSTKQNRRNKFLPPVVVYLDFDVHALKEQCHEISQIR